MIPPGPQSNTLPATPHPCGCLYEPPTAPNSTYIHLNQRSSCSLKKGVVGVHCCFLNGLTIWTVRANGMSAARMHTRTHTYAHGARKPGSWGRRMLKKMPEPHTQKDKYNIPLVWKYSLRGLDLTAMYCILGNDTVRKSGFRIRH